MKEPVKYQVTELREGHPGDMVLRRPDNRTYYHLSADEQSDTQLYLKSVGFYQDELGLIGIPRPVPSAILDIFTDNQRLMTAEEIQFLSKLSACVFRYRATIRHLADKDEVNKDRRLRILEKLPARSARVSHRVWAQASSVL